ncbi:hypothetical protein T01_4430 [Trichinella spiralis]|uniref:Uncharacterized protein n=1 Tax=Trichinella spiralis TaxID=6334 RepID=A0A0V1BWI8_TRISP|nr:hypothetical protein T01_4430 [Trichinella spiralis]
MGGVWSNEPPLSTTKCQVNCVQIEDETERTLKKFLELDSIRVKPQEENITQESISAQFPAC